MDKQTFFNLVDSLPHTGPKSCQIWPPGDPQPERYPSVTVTGEPRRGHRIVLGRKLGRRVKRNMYACHTCDTPGCVNEDHLYEGTPADNNADMKARRRQRYGDNHWTRHSPEKIKRGEKHWAQHSPEKLKYGKENHFSYNAPRGEERYAAKLTPDLVRAIRRDWDDRGNTSACALGRKYGVSYNTIQRVGRRESWTHVED